MDPVYASREDVKSALESHATARNDGQIMRALGMGARTVEGLTHRTFYPWTGTKFFDYPTRSGRVGSLWLGENEIISASALTAGGTSVAPADYYLEPAASGPPYSRIDTNRAVNASFNVGGSYQRNIAVTGVFGYDLSDSPAGTAAEALDAVETELTVSDGSLVGVGDLLKVDSERLWVTEKATITTGQTLQAPVDAKASTQALTVTSGAAFHPGEMLLLDAERVAVLDVSGNVLIVRRGVDGSAIAAHTSSVVYAYRSLTVERGVLGTLAATHVDGSALRRHEFPALVVELNIALAVNHLLQQGAGYARTAGSGDNERESNGRGLADIRRDCVNTYARQQRGGAI